MKKIYIFIISLSITASAAHTAVMCKNAWWSALNSNAELTGWTTHAAGGFWSAMSPDGDELRGVSYCTNNSASFSINTGSSCWCHMTGLGGPSNWVYVRTGVDCGKYCAGDCVECVHRGWYGDCVRSEMFPF